MNLFRIQYIKTQTIMRKLFAKQRMRGQSRSSIGAIRSHGKCIEDLRCDQRSVAIPSFPRSENNTIDNSGAAIKQVWQSTAGIPSTKMRIELRHSTSGTLNAKLLMNPWCHFTYWANSRNSDTQIQRQIKYRIPRGEFHWPRYTLNCHGPIPI